MLNFRRPYQGAIFPVELPVAASEDGFACRLISYIPLGWPQYARTYSANILHAWRRYSENRSIHGKLFWHGAAAQGAGRFACAKSSSARQPPPSALINRTEA